MEYLKKYLRENMEYLLTLILVILIYYYFYGKKKINLPPGPIGLPFLGYLPFLGKKPFLTLHSLTLKYGPVFSLQLGRSRVMVLGSFKTAKEALTNPLIMDRPAHPPNHLLPDSTSLSVSSGHDWKEQRQFTVQLLRKLGMGKLHMETIIQGEIRYLLDIIALKRGNPLNLNEFLLPSVSNNIYTLLFGHRLDFEDKERKFLNTVLRTMTVYFKPTIVHAYYPRLKWWFETFHIWGYDRVHALMTKFGKLAESKMKEVKFQKEAEDEPQSYLHGYLNKMNGTNKEDSTFSVQMLKGNFLSLVGAGSTPGRATIEWACVCMVHQPDIQKKVREEIHAVIGREKMPSWTDRNELPYTMAVIMEVMRSNTIIPVSMLRCASEDTKIGKYDVPKGTIVMTNLWSIHHHPEYWSDPMKFNPERFLRDGKIVKPVAFVPYSYGKRNCLGEDLANMLVFLYFASIMQKFQITSKPGDSAKFQEVLGIANMVIPDNVCFLEDKA